jgi:hypothetical protein
MMRRGTRCVVLWTTRGVRSQELWLKPTFLDWLLATYKHVVAVACGKTRSAQEDMSHET